MASDYGAIRSANKRRYGTDIGRIGPMLLANRYDDRTHFIFELLQNAEDALARRGGWRGSRSVRFELSATALRVSHFGQPFDDDDVRGICGIADSTKDLTRIGRFGIGFKSVYAFTDRPEVHSGDEHFAIDNYVWPTSVPPIARQSEETVFIIPLRPDDHTAHNELALSLQRLGARTLLFLRQVKEISWKVDGGPTGTYRRRVQKTVDEGVRRLELTGEATDAPKANESWLLFAREARAVDGSLAGHVELAFSLAPQTGPDTYSIRPVTDSPLVVFFPTVLPTHLGFLVQGPYRTTPSRDNVPRNDGWNQDLVQQTSALLKSAMLWLRDRDMLDTAALECLPLEPDKFGEGSMFRSLFETVRETMATEAVLPRYRGGHIAASRARLARTSELRELISATQLGKLYSKGRLAWLSDEISSDPPTCTGTSRQFWA
jgi:hypothetical protein